MTSKEKSGSSETESATPQPNDTQDKRLDWWRLVALLAAIVVILVLAKVYGTVLGWLYDPRELA